MAATPENTRKRNDTSPPFRLLLQDRDGPVDLTAATLINLLLLGGETPHLVTITCTADAGQAVAPTLPIPTLADLAADDFNPVEWHMDGQGWIEGPIDEADLSVDGEYQGEVQVTDPDGKRTWPNFGYLAYTILPDLDAD